MQRFQKLKKQDPALFRFIRAELERQAATVDLIPSENFASPAILEALGSELTNKYSEGYPGRRYYPGNRWYDAIERLAQERALRTFKLSPTHWSVNVQPYSGSPANIAIYAALMELACPPKPGGRRRGDTLLGMALASGGHLTHGHKVNFSGRAWKAVQYGVNSKTGLIDYAEVERLAKKHKPKVIVSGITAYPRRIDFRKFGAVAKKVGAYHVADISHIAGLVAAGLHPSPFPHADVVMTTTHKPLRGPRGAVIFARKAKVKSQKSKVTIAEAIDRAVFPGMQGGPHNNVTAAIAAMFGEALQPSFKQYQRQIVRNAKALASSLAAKGFRLITGGTDNHMLLADVRPLGIDGMTAQHRLEAVGITANRNAIPGDPSPFRPSGLRMGTPAITTRGMKEREMKLLADIIHATLSKTESSAELKRRVHRLTGQRRA